MRAAVTGGSGVVGRALVRHLVGKGHDVSALARSDRAAIAISKLGARPVSGDVTDPDSLDPLVRASDVVFNVAGVNKLCPRDPARMWRVNVEGALAILEACERSDVRRLVHTSSAVTIGAPGDVIANETTHHRGHFLSEYERSKTVAERLLVNRSGPVQVVLVNPASVQGPGRSTGTGGLLLAAARGRARFAVNTVISLVDIEDCAAGHLAAAELGVSGGRYILSGATTSVRRLMRLIGSLTTGYVSPLYLSPKALRALGPLLAKLDRFLPADLPVCEESIRVLVEGHRYDGTKAVTELGVVYTPLETTLRRTIDWFEESGLI